ncbi:MAG TPA: hypothetical protein VFJ70_08500 [Burkholderiales bacterium]|nr:hypothetical protein [Burkholderiales bacterium]
MIRSLIVALGVSAAPAAAQDQPETVYANFHRAGLAADYDGMRKYESAAKAKQMDPIPPAERAPMLQTLARLLPRNYYVVEKTVEDGARRAVLRLRGTQPAISGTITLVKEKGEWKVDDANWGGR